jgi:hypothetical protein
MAARAIGSIIFGAEGIYPKNFAAISNPLEGFHPIDIKRRKVAFFSLSLFAIMNQTPGTPSGTFEMAINGKHSETSHE